jgi:hypothetical protein
MSPQHSESAPESDWRLRFSGRSAAGPPLARPWRVKRVLRWCSFLCLGGCALAFSPGVGPSPTPEKFQDTDQTAVREEKMKLESTASTAPTFGMSVVVGGERMDSGTLPKAPFPIVLLH